MEDKDEEIMKKKKAAAKAIVDETIEQKKEEQKKESIYDEYVHIENEKVTFVRRNIDEIGISLLMPEIFELLDDETRVAFYPLGNAPQYVYTEFSIPFHIALNKTKNIVPDDGIPKLMKWSTKLVENYGPKAKVLASGVIKHLDHNIGIIEMVTRAIDGNVYNVMFYISINNEVRIGNIHFAAKYNDRMIPIAKQIIDSIEFLEEKKDGNNHISES